MESSLAGARQDPISMWGLRLGPLTWNLGSCRIYLFARIKSGGVKGSMKTSPGRERNTFDL
ncbi:hypothetical protein Gotri_014735 [Gossypium trilobum]|uniref:Uncharacterized protein n=1 Tax=Gossypium trilobum TaxID=34281 RepID=A0A7J9DXY6_9ROSI|nr:hypothetical protein [Gossypium trilobum]